MRNIQKKTEPRSLTTYRLQAGARYKDFPQKDELRQQLVEEQRGLCCYCQSRIRAEWDGMKVEHWQCQDNYPERCLDYSNMLGACRGGEGRPEHEQHCDSRKGNRDFRLNPADPTYDVERHLRFLGDGRITSDDADLDRELNDVLNLNSRYLEANRKKALEAFQQRLQRGRPLDAARELPRWDGSRPGELPEFAQVIVYYLRKKLRKAG
jgi:uncharacterized protein (TIGR02646 family)